MAIYLEYDFTVSPLQPGTEILIAQLGYAGFESFVENQTGVWRTFKNRSVARLY